VRESPTALERCLFGLDVLIDRLGALPEFDQRPAVDQDREVMAGIDELRMVAAAEFRVNGKDRPTELLSMLADKWSQATAATHPQEWARAADHAGALLIELSDFVAVMSRRPSVLRATAGDVEIVLRNAIARERSLPGTLDFYQLSRAHVAGVPTEAFAVASEAVAKALTDRDMDEEDDPPVELRLGILERATAIAGDLVTQPRSVARAVGLFSITAENPSEPGVVYVLNPDKTVSIRVLSPDLREFVDTELRDGVRHKEKRLFPSDGESFLNALVARNANTSYVAWGELPREVA
jgi:hypothetical protein